MLTSSSAAQYINPDYLQPLPTTLDAKKSPLALLAQTCSSIGKDTTSKSLIPPLDKKEGEKNTDKSNNDGIKRESKDKESSSSNSKPGFRTIQNKDIPPLVPVSRSSEDQKTPSPTPSKSSPRPPKEKTSSPQTDLTSGPPRSISSHSSGSHRNMADREDDRGKRPGSSPRSPHRFTRDSGSYGDIAKSVCSTSQSPYSSYPSISSSFPHYTHAGHGLSPDAAAAHFAGYPLPLPAHGAFGSSSAAAAALAAQSSALAAQSALKAGMGSSFSPYVTYARVRTPSGATTLVPVCRDPYCTHCQLTEQNAHLSSTCTAVGCAQCAHEKSLQNLSMGLNGSSFSHLQSLQASGLLTSVPSSSLHLSSPLYAHSALSGHAQSAFPFACNWVSPGNEHCGKRFTTSEELLQHLRTHTTAAADPLSLAASYDRYSLAAAAAAAGGLPGLHGHLPTPGSVSPNSLRRSYPTSLSPLSGLMGPSRYHPYKSMINPQAGLSPAQHHPGLSPYLSHYSLYGQRLGAAAVP